MLAESDITAVDTILSGQTKSVVRLDFHRLLMSARDFKNWDYNRHENSANSIVQSVVE